MSKLHEEEVSRLKAEISKKLYRIREEADAALTALEAHEHLMLRGRATVISMTTDPLDDLILRLRWAYSLAYPTCQEEGTTLPIYYPQNEE